MSWGKLRIQMSSGLFFYYRPKIGIVNQNMFCLQPPRESGVLNTNGEATPTQGLGTQYGGVGFSAAQVSSCLHNVVRSCVAWSPERLSAIKN